jgi:hypothetical protein
MPSEYLTKELFIKDPSEKELKPGCFPERWMKIIDAQVAIWQKILEQQIASRQQNQPEGEGTLRSDLIQSHLDEYFTKPSFKGGPYQNNWHKNLNEILISIIDLDAESLDLPDKDKRIDFWSEKLDKKSAILDWLRKKIFASLAKEQELTEKQINDMFNNISQEQMNALKQELINSVLHIKSMTAQQSWEQTIEKNKP